MSSAAIAIRAQQPRHAQSGKFTSSNLWIAIASSIIVVSSTAIEHKAMSIGKNCFAHYFQGRLRVKTWFQRKNSWITRSIITRCQITRSIITRCRVCQGWLVMRGSTVSKFKTYSTKHVLCCLFGRFDILKLTDIIF